MKSSENWCLRISFMIYLFSSNNIHKKDNPLTTSTIIRNRKMRQHFKKKSEKRFPRKNDVWFIFIPCCFVGFMFYLCYLYLFTYTSVKYDFHIRWCSRCLTITRRVSRVEQEQLTLPEHPSSPSIFSFLHNIL
jgi:hypothetical protein